MPNSASQNFKDPAFLADATVFYTADEFRQIFDALGSPGRRDDNSLVVSQHAGTAGMTVDIGPGVAIVGSGSLDTAGLPVNGHYAARLLSAISGLGITSAPTSGSRIDVVYLQIADKTVVGSGNNEFIVKVMTGVASANPAEPALATDSLKLASILVGTNVTAILNSAITRNMNFCVPAGQAQYITNATVRSPNQGWSWGVLTGPYQYDGFGSSWSTPPGANHTINAVAGHTYLIVSVFTMYGHLPTQTNIRCSIQVDSTVLGETFETTLQPTASQSLNTTGEHRNSTTLLRTWQCTVTGTHVVSTQVATASNSVSAGLIQPYSSPYTEFVDLGPM